VIRAFFDTNIFIYAFTKHADERKQQVAVSLFERIGYEGHVILSTQVLNEFISASTRKSRPPLASQVVEEYVEFMSGFEVVITDIELIRLAIRRSDLSVVNYYDALILEAALRANADVLYSEDMQHGFQLGNLQVINPFKVEV
jgi:predicted nucleic acid-binding protein